MATVSITCRVVLLTEISYAFVDCEASIPSLHLPEERSCMAFNLLGHYAYYMFFGSSSPVVAWSVFYVVFMSSALPMNLVKGGRVEEVVHEMGVCCLPFLVVLRYPRFYFCRNWDFKRMVFRPSEIIIQFGWEWMVKSSMMWTRVWALKYASVNSMIHTIGYRLILRYQNSLIMDIILFIRWIYRKQVSSRKPESFCGWLRIRYLWLSFTKFRGTFSPWSAWVVRVL